MKFINSSSRAWLLTTSLLCACAPLSSVVEAEPPRVLTSDNQAGIWFAGITLYAKGKFLPAADLFQLAYQLKPASRISQNIGMAYFKAAQLIEHPDVLRLVYVRRALPHLKGYRLWLISDYGRTHAVAVPLTDTNQRISEAERLEKKLRAVVERPRTPSTWHQAASPEGAE